MKDDDLDDLLAGGQFSGPRRDALRDRVSQATRSPRARRVWIWPTFAAAVAAAVLLVMVRRADDSAFVARGTTETHAHIRALVVGTKIVFEVSDLAQSAYLAAYAIGPDGERAWYFPGDDSTTPAVAASAEPHVLPQAVSASAGQYHVVVQLFDRPLTRAEVLTQKAFASADTLITVAP